MHLNAVELMIGARVLVVLICLVVVFGAMCVLEIVMEYGRRDCALCLGSGKGKGDAGEEIVCVICSGSGRLD